MTKRRTVCLLIILAALLLSSCKAASGLSGTDSPGEADTAFGTDEPKSLQTGPVIGFSQLGAESDWRRAHTESMMSEFTSENGYNLLFEDGQQKQSNQIMAIRTFIQQEVDYIVLAPVTETGWDTVLEEARDAGIPVILVDRMVKVKDPDLFTCWIGSDFELEGKKATEWLHQYSLEKGIDPSQLHIVNIQGTIGSSAQIGRSKGLRDAASKYGWDLMQEVSGDFTQTKGREVMASMLRLYQNINVVYCENDNEALGAIEAIEAAGKVPGMDIEKGEILVMSFDGMNKDAVSYALEGKIACIAECNPLHGKRVASVIGKLEKGEEVEKYSYIDEELYSGSEDVKWLPIEDKNYPVTILTETLIEHRDY